MLYTLPDYPSVPEVPGYLADQVYPIEYRQRRTGLNLLGHFTTGTFFNHQTCCHAESSQTHISAVCLFIIHSTLIMACCFFFDMPDNVNMQPQCSVKIKINIPAISQINFYNYYFNYSFMKKQNSPVFHLYPVLAILVLLSLPWVLVGQPHCRVLQGLMDSCHTHLPGDRHAQLH